jgi:hypothetical protein
MRLTFHSRRHTRTPLAGVDTVDHNPGRNGYYSYHSSHRSQVALSNQQDPEKTSRTGKKGLTAWIQTIIGSRPRWHLGLWNIQPRSIGFALCPQQVVVIDIHSREGRLRDRAAVEITLGSLDTSIGEFLFQGRLSRNSLLGLLLDELGDSLDISSCLKIDRATLTYFVDLVTDVFLHDQLQY